MGSTTNVVPLSGSKINKPDNWQNDLMEDAMQEEFQSAKMEAEVPKLSRKELKEQKRKQEYMNSMISRGEVINMIESVIGSYLNKESENRQFIEMMYLFVRTMADMMVEKGVCTEEDLENKQGQVLFDIKGQKGDDTKDGDKQQEQG